MLDPVQVHPDGDVRGPVLHAVPVADLHHQRVQVDDRVDLLQRPGLPGFDLVQDPVGDLRDGLVRQLRPEGALKVMLDVADGHPARIQRDDHVVQAAGPAGALRDQPRLEAAGPIPRHRQSHVADLGGQGLRARPVTRVRAAPPGRIAFLIAQMPGQLRGQPSLEDCFDHLREEPALPGQPQLAGIRPGHHVIEQTRLDHLIDRSPRPRRPLTRGHTQRIKITLFIGHSHVSTSHVLRGSSYTDHLTRPARPSPAPPRSAGVVCY
jgi:hypothetical protein